jgi:hypothetical protein
LNMVTTSLPGIHMVGADPRGEWIARSISLQVTDNTAYFV